jgi:hypothetical protein
MWSSRPSYGRAISRRASLSLAIVSVAIVALLSSVSSAHAQTADAAPLVPPPSPPRTARPRNELVWAGASVFALSYLASALAATTGYAADDWTLSTRARFGCPL